MESNPVTVAAHRHYGIRYDRQIQDLLTRETKVFRVDGTMVGVSDFPLVSAVVAARPVLAKERSVFKPAAGAEIGHDSATRSIHALGRDVMAGVETAPPPAQRLSGEWPYAASSYLREWLFASDPLPMSLLRKRRITSSDLLSQVVDRAVTVWPGSGGEGRGSMLGRQIVDAADTRERRQAIALYRRATATLSDGVAALVANSLWLMGPERSDVPRTELTAVLWETLRLLPPAWMLLRSGGDVYDGLHPDIRSEDNIALFPLLMHRDPDHWSDPLEFRPERWHGVGDPEKTSAFMPFGFEGARCWAKHLVVPLAERLLNVALDNRITLHSPEQQTHIPLRSLLSVRFTAEVAAA
ncbi:cytochrome P450 [Actinacidiphila sp. bgisy167]|uniref:cytochrome P450 n=1 Tax=Actinacidiphila sp. bgisy167 TaxID=3413797 RepID=UPI003D71BCEE